MAEQRLTNFRLPEPLSLQGNVAEGFKIFKKRFQTYMKATGASKADGETKVAILLNLIGEEAHDLYSTFELTSVQEGNMEEVMSAFEAYCTPKKNVIYERFVFYSRNKQRSETFDQFLTDIRKLAKSCEFAETESMIRDRIVLGINSDSIQGNLLRIPDLTLSKAIDHCRAAELTAAQVKELQKEKNGDTDEKNIDLIKTKTPVEKTKGDRNKQGPQWYQCNKCGTKHRPLSCPAFGKTCNTCKRRNHFATCCYQNKYNQEEKRKWNVHKMAEFETDDEEVDAQQFTINAMSRIGTHKGWYETLKINGKVVKFKLDTGSEVNVLPWAMYKEPQSKLNKIERKPVKIMAYGGTIINQKGAVVLPCRIKGNKIVQIEFVLIDTSDTPILGLETCKRLNLLQRINALKVNRPYKNKEEFIASNRDIFEGLGCYPVKQKISIEDSVVPIMKPPYRVAESLRDRLKKTLDRYEKQGIIGKVIEPTEWCHNLVIVEKPDGTLRLCLDPKEINKVIRRERFQIPTSDELTPGLANKRVYTVLDMTDGFFQLQLDEPSSLLCTFHTPYGRYKFNRMPFGLSSAPETFQRITSQLFGEIPGVTAYFDDIIISARDNEEHDIILEKVLDKAREYNVKFNKQKIQYKVERVKYIGQIFSQYGIQPDPEQVEAIRCLKEPTDKKQLQGMLGMINYLGKYIPQLSSITAPLRNLLKKDMPWAWTKPQSEALKEIKNRISNAPTLKCYDSKQSLTIQTDSSRDGLGCCLLMNGSPISFASRSLSQAERHYAQIEKELLSICFACRKFHTFIYGRNVEVHTDHKPLESIVKKDIGKISMRLQRMCLSLLKYNLDIKYLPGKLMFVADLLSRNYMKREEQEPEAMDKVHVVTKQLPISDERLKELQEETKKDKSLSAIMERCHKGWEKTKNKTPTEASWAWKLKEKLHVKQNLLFLDEKIVIPESLKGHMLRLLHETHLGIVKTKQRARQIIYWRGMSQDIETLISKCRVCEKFQSANIKEPIIQRETPSYPFETVGTDICTFEGRDYLILACYKTKWLEIKELKTKTAGEIIGQLKTIFSTHGTPRTLISDNIPFASAEFYRFANDWGFKQSLTSPYYPKSNGFAERMVGVSKSILKRVKETKGDLSRALLEYRNAPLDGLTASPAQLNMSRMLRDKLPTNMKCLKPRVIVGIDKQVERLKRKKETYYDTQARRRPSPARGSSILIKTRDGWEPATVKEKYPAPRSYIVTNQEGKDYRRNKHHIRMSRNPEPARKMAHKEEYIKVEQEEMELVKEERNEIEQERQTNGTPGHSKVQGRYVTRTGRVINRPSRLNDYVE